MSELSKEELLKITGDSIEEGRRNIRDLKGSLDISQDEFDERFHKLNQAEQQAREIINLHFSDDWQKVKKDLGKFMQKQTVGKKRGLTGMAGEIFNEAHKKPEVTEEWIKEKGMRIAAKYGISEVRARKIIRSLVEELK